jgi:hypothetical protein
MNPACMKKTRKAVTSTHTVLRGLMTSGRWTTTCPRAASAGERKYQFNAVSSPSTAMTPSILPAKITAHSRRVSFSPSLRSLVMGPDGKKVRFHTDSGFMSTA